MDVGYATFKAIQAAIDWANEDICVRSVKISCESNLAIPIEKESTISIWCCDISTMNGVHLKMKWFDPEDPVGSINKAINRAVENGEREQLERLKKKYEPGTVKDGVEDGRI